MGERRGSLRNKSFLRGCVYFNKGRTAIDCLIRDLSSQGARIVFSDAVSVPDVVDIYVPQKDQTLRARVKWRRGDEIGLAFPNRIADNPPATGELALRVTKLEDEIALLRRMLRRLKREVQSAGNEDAA